MRDKDHELSVLGKRLGEAMSSQQEWEHRARTAEAEVERLRAGIEELAASPPEHMAKMPWSTYHVALRLVGLLRTTAAKPEEKT